MTVAKLFCHVLCSADNLTQYLKCQRLLIVVDGFYNCLSATAVNFICDHPAIRAISFVGSNQAGEYIYERGSKNGKRVQSNMVSIHQDTCCKCPAGGSIGQQIPDVFVILLLTASCTDVRSCYRACSCASLPKSHSYKCRIYIFRFLSISPLGYTDSNVEQIYYIKFVGRLYATP